MLCSTTKCLFLPSSLNSLPTFLACYSDGREKSNGCSNNFTVTDTFKVNRSNQHGLVRCTVVHLDHL